MGSSSNPAHMPSHWADRGKGGGEERYTRLSLGKNEKDLRALID